MTFPTPYTVGWHTHSDGAVDAHNNPTSVYTPGLSVAGAPTKVHGWAPASSFEPVHDRVVHDIDLFVPSNVGGGPQDVVDLPEGQFEVVGWPLDWTHGPFAPGFGGKVVQLRRVQR